MVTWKPAPWGTIGICKESLVYVMQAMHKCGNAMKVPIYLWFARELILCQLGIWNCIGWVFSDHLYCMLYKSWCFICWRIKCNLLQPPQPVPPPPWMAPATHFPHTCILHKSSMLVKHKLTLQEPFVDKDFQAINIWIKLEEWDNGVCWFLLVSPIFPYSISNKIKFLMVDGLPIQMGSDSTRCPMALWMQTMSFSTAT